MLLPLGRGLLLLAALAACQPVARPASAPRAAGLTADGGGLQPVGTPLRIDFGRAQAGAVVSVTRLLGRPPARVVPVPGCGTEAVWSEGLTMTFAADGFRGWRIEGGGLTAGTLSVGGPEAPAPAGVVVEAENGRVSRLSAGRTCG
ncbi:hypothetical protein HKCCE2091_21375 [Rhodobacterales bacterium HKCCE2091]|nr:hypothetical protein [Rhodobacterales bacterium HKCCE2091]